MLFDRPLTDALVRHLATHRHATILQLYDHIQTVESISRPNFYKIISQLVDRQILAKDGKKIQLNAVWMVEYLDLARQIEGNFDDSPSLRHLNPGETQQFTANSLWEIDPIYGDIYLRIIKRTKASVMYHYNSHLYHIHAFPETEKQFRESLRVSGTKQYLVCGNETFLDQHAAELVRHYGGVKVVHQTIEALPAQGYMLVVIGDRVIDCAFPTQLASGFRFFFDTVQSFDQFNLDLYTSLFHQKDKITVTVTHDADRAKSVSKILQRVFKT